MNRAVFLDRDGVINRVVLKDGKPFSPRTLKEFVLRDDIASFLSKSRRARFLNIVITNQPDISRGLMVEGELEKMNDYIRTHLPIDDILVCPHDDTDNCLCRKPKAGMLLRASRKWGINLKTTFFIGDQQKDIDAGRKVGCRTILIDCPYNKDVNCDYRVYNLDSAIDIILSE